MNEPNDILEIEDVDHAKKLKAYSDMIQEQLSKSGGGGILLGCCVGHDKH